jgi:hypothetical protein
MGKLQRYFIYKMKIFFYNKIIIIELICSEAWFTFLFFNLNMITRNVQRLESELMTYLIFNIILYCIM